METDVNNSDNREWTVSENDSKLMASKNPNENDNDKNDEKLEIDALPDDITFRVIQLLPKRQWPVLESVNRQFQRAVHEAWRSTRSIQLDDDFIVKTVDEPDYDPLAVSIFEKLLLRAPNLSSISGYFVGIEGWKMGKETINVLCQFNKLENFRMRYWTALNEEYWTSMTVTNLAIFLETSASRGCLKEVDIHVLQDRVRERNASNSLLSDVSNRPMVQLEKLSLRSYNCYSSWDIFNSIDTSSLTKLDLFCFDISLDNLILLLNGSKKLKELAVGISCPKGCKENAVRHESFVNALESLEHLSVFKMVFAGGCYRKVDSDLARLFEYFGRRRRLDELELRPSTMSLSYVLQSIVLYMTHLKSIRIVTCKDNPETISTMCELVASLKDLKKLEIPDGKILKSVVDLRQLEILHVGCRGETPNDWDNLINLENMKELRLNKCSLKSETLEIWNRQSNLKIEYFGLPLFKGDIGQMVLFISKLAKLRRLDLSNTKITDKDLEAIAKGCPLLDEVILSECEHVTLNGVQALVDRCPGLQKVIVPPVFKEPELKVGKYRNKVYLYYGYYFYGD